MQMVVALKPIHDAAGIERLVVSTYQAVSGTGQRAIDELREQSQAMLAGEEARPPRSTRTRSPSTSCPRSRPSRTATTTPTEERKLMAETRKILGDRRGVGISRHLRAGARSSPATRSRSTSQTREDLSPEDCRELLAEAPGVIVVDDPAAGALPAGDRRRRPRRRPRRPHPPRPRPRALPQPLGRRRQPAQGRRDQRRPGRRAAGRARPAQRPGVGRGHRLRRGACCSSAGCSRSSRRSPG